MLVSGGPARLGSARPGPDATRAPVLQEIVRGPAGGRAPAGGGADRERPAGESGARGRAVLAEPMESPARPDAAGPRSRVAEEAPPPGGESRWAPGEARRGALPRGALAR